MTQLIEYTVEDGQKVILEIRDEYIGSGVQPASRGDGLLIKAEQTFDQALESIRPAAISIIKKLKKLHEPPNEIELEFGINLNASVGAVVATTTLDANYKVTLRWKQTSANE